MTNKVAVTGLFLVLAAIGCALTILGGAGDASVVASTAGVASILESHGQAASPALQSDLIEVIMRLQGPWSIVSNVGFATILVSLIGVVTVLRRPN